MLQKSGAPTILVAPATAERYKHICASEPQNVCALLAASPTKRARKHSEHAGKHTLRSEEKWQYINAAHSTQPHQTSKSSFIKKSLNIASRCTA